MSATEQQQLELAILLETMLFGCKESTAVDDGYEEPDEDNTPAQQVNSPAETINLDILTGAL